MSKRLIFVVVGLALVLGLVGCSSEHAIFLHQDVRVAPDMNSMVKDAPIIVEGVYVKLEKTENTARDPRNLSKEDTKNRNETEFYRFQVEKVLKGTCEQKSILVSKQKRLMVNDLVDQEGNPIEVMVKKPTYIPTEIGKRTILFLEPVPFNGSYKGAFANFEVTVGENELLTMKKPSEKVNDFLTLDGQLFRIQVEAPIELTDRVTGVHLNTLLNKIRLLNTVNE